MSNTPNLSLEKSELQSRLNKGCELWSENHAAKYNSINTLPFSPFVFRDQRIERTSRRATRAAIFLPELAYVKAFRYVYAKAVGSRALAETIVDGFNTTPASINCDNSQSLTAKTIDFLGGDSDESAKSGMAMAVASAHLDRLTDITDFTGGLSLAVAEETGKKYRDRFSVIVNKNVTRETYKGVPLPWLISLALNVYFGMPPGKSANDCGIDKVVSDYINAMMSSTMLRDKKAKGRVVWGIVPAGSGMVPLYEESTGELSRLSMKDTSYTSPLLARCEAGVIPAGRYGDNIEIGSIVANERSEAVSKRQHEKLFTDSYVKKLAEQALALTGGATIEYPSLTGQVVKQLSVKQAKPHIISLRQSSASTV